MYSVYRHVWLHAILFYSAYDSPPAFTAGESPLFMPVDTLRGYTRTFRADAASALMTAFTSIVDIVNGGRITTL